MSVKIRLARTGAKKDAHFRVVVASSSSPRDGSFIEKIGHYHPMLGKDAKDRVVINKERVEYWLSQGARPTEVVIRFIKASGVALPRSVQKTHDLKVKNRVAKQPKKKAEA